jgi:hypothetical protein
MTARSLTSTLVIAVKGEVRVLAGALLAAQQQRNSNNQN